jgi:glycosyltransferase involved in cell wall biosynthesis
MFMGLMKGQEEIGTEKRVFYYETRKIGLREFELPYVDSCASNVNCLPSPFLRFARLNIVKKQMFKLYESNYAFDCIHAHTIIADGYLALAAYKKWGIPYVVTVRNSDFNFKPYWKYKYYRKKIIEIITSAKKIVFLSKPFEDLFLSQLTKSEKENLPELCIVPNGIDNYWHDNVYERSMDGLPEKNEWNVITVGKLCKRKNQIICCEAVKKLKEAGYHINYEMVGKPEDKKMLDAVLSYGFVDYREQMNREALIHEYRNNDIFLLASTGETFGLVYAEALSQGLPVIYTKGQGFDGQFPEGFVGYSTSPSDAEEIKNKIIRTMRNYKSIIPNCIEASRRFDWNLVAKQLESVYESII